MAIVIDVNVFQMVFDPSNVNHEDFAPVKAWIESREGFLLYGGTKYKQELLLSYRTAKLVRLLRDGGSAIEIRSEVVDAITEDVEKAVAGTKCNDPHIIGLLAAAHCNLLCSRDVESYPFIKSKKYYPKGAPKVRIYSARRNVDLLKRSDRTKIRNCV